MSFIDFAPTMLELAGIDDDPGLMQKFDGKSLSEIFFSTLKGQVDLSRDYVLLGKERHDIGRPKDWGYPIRAIVKDHYIYLHNFEPDRWPTGNPETGYTNCAGSPTKTIILNSRKNNLETLSWEKSFGKRTQEELYYLKFDPWCMNNLAHSPKHEKIKNELKKKLFESLKDEGDPRMFDKGTIFDEYPFSNKSLIRLYEKSIVNGEDVRVGWVRKSDIEYDLIDTPKLKELYPKFGK